MITKERQIKNSFIYLLPVVVGNLVPLITLPVFTRVLTKEDYGVLALAQIYAVFMTGLANFGLTVGYERNFFEYSDRKKSSELLYSTLLFVVIAYLICGIATFFLKVPLSKWIIGTQGYESLLFWSFCSTGFMSLKVYYLTYFKNTENAKSLVWYTIDESILGVVFSLVFVAYMRVGVIGLVFGQLLASITVFTTLAVRFFKLLSPSFNWLILKDSLKLSYPLTPRIFLGVIGNQFDKYMIGLMATVSGVGIYSIGQSVSYAVFTCMTAIQNVFSPQVYSRMFQLGNKGGEAVGRYLTPFAYLSILFGLIISTFAEEIILILTPKSYHGATDIVILLSMLYGSYFFGKQPQLIFAKKTHITSILTLVGIMLNVAINIPLIMKWGAIGAAWGALVAGILSGVLSFVISQRYYRIHWEYRRLAQIYGIFFISSLLIILMRYCGIDYLIRVMSKMTFFTIYILLGVQMNIISLEHMNLIKKMIFLKDRTAF